MTNKFSIPPRSHHIWLTNPNNPKTLKESDINNLANTLHILDNSHNTSWQHIIWTNYEPSVENIGHLDIKVRNIGNYASKFKGYNAIMKLIEQDSIVIAADITRYEVVYLLGGFYSDLNYVLLTYPENLMYEVNFFAPAIPFLGIENNMFGSSRHHPILEQALDRSISIVDGHLAKNIPMSSLGDMTTLAYLSFTISFNNNANKGGMIDVRLFRDQWPCKDMEDCSYSPIGYDVKDSTALKDFDL